MRPAAWHSPGDLYEVTYADGDREDYTAEEVEALLIDDLYVEVPRSDAWCMYQKDHWVELHDDTRQEALVGQVLWAPPAAGQPWVKIKVGNFVAGAEYEYMVEYLVVCNVCNAHDIDDSDMEAGLCKDSFSAPAAPVQGAWDLWEEDDFIGCRVAGCRVAAQAPRLPLTYAPTHLRDRSTGRRWAPGRERARATIDVDLAVSNHVDSFMADLGSAMDLTHNGGAILATVRRLLSQHAKGPFVAVNAAKGAAAMAIKAGKAVAAKAERKAAAAEAERKECKANTANAANYSVHKTQGDLLIGTGFTSDSSLRRHALKWQKRLEVSYKGNMVKCVEVAEQLATRFGVLEGRVRLDTFMLNGEPLDEKTLEACLAVCTSMKVWSEKINDQFTGRFSNKARSIYLAAAQAASLDTTQYMDDGSVAALCCRVGLARRGSVIGISESVMKQGRTAWVDCMKEYYSGGKKSWGLDPDTMDGLLTLRGRTRSDKMPAVWTEKIVATWFDNRVTRRSEVARDQLLDKTMRGKPDALVKMTVPKYFMETRQHMAIKKIIDICTDHFAEGYEYVKPPLDKHGKVRLFSVSPNFVRLLRPYNVVPSFGNRDTSLCRYHMAFEFIYGALWKWQKLARDKQLVDREHPMIAHGWSNFRRQLVCNPGYQKDSSGVPIRDSYGDLVRKRYDLPACKAGTCEECKELRLLLGHGGKAGLLSRRELECKLEVDWQLWTKYTCPVHEIERTDFRNIRTDIHGIVAELQRVLDHKAVNSVKDGGNGKRPTVWTDFLEHHDLMKYMEDNKAHIRRHFPRGHVHVIEDYSENGEFIVRREHQSRYYQTHAYTLFGMVVECHVEDIKDCLVPKAEREKLIAMLDRERPGEPGHIVTLMHIVVSEDTVHDPAAVMHFNSEVLFPWLKANIKGFAEGSGVVHYTTDGAPTQFANKDIYYWITRCKARYNILADWVIGCAAHNKDVSDGECGHAKNSVNAVNLEYDHTGDTDGRGKQIQTVPEVKTHLEENFKLLRTLYQKKGRGILMRIVHHVPLKAINRRIPTVKSMDGSKKLHQVLDMGTPGTGMVRPRPCHKCDGCKLGDAEKIMADCNFKVLCGMPFTFTFNATAPAVVRLAGSDAEAKGRELAGEAKVGDFLAVEVTKKALPFLIGEVVLTDDVVQFEWNEDAKAKWAGSNNDMDTTSEPTLNEKAIRIRLWMPLDNGGGSAMYKLTDTVVPVPSKHVLFRITDDTEAQLFKRRRMKVPVQCTNGHAMEQNKANPDDKECDNVPLGLCSSDSACPWHCPIDGCNSKLIDLCDGCHEKKAKIRLLDSSAKSDIFKAMPSDALDPFRTKVYNTKVRDQAWHKLYTVTDSSKNLQAIAMELQVSQKQLIEENQYDGRELTAATCFKKDSTLWMPGHGDNYDECEFGLGCCPLPSTPEASPENSDNDSNNAMEVEVEEEQEQGRQCSPAEQQLTEQRSKRSKQRQADGHRAVRRLQHGNIHANEIDDNNTGDINI